MVPVASYVKSDLWPNGIRVLARDGHFLATTANRTVACAFRCEDPTLAEELVPLVSKHLTASLNKKLENVKSRYRGKVTTKGKSFKKMVGKGTTAKKHQLTSNRSTQWRRGETVLLFPLPKRSKLPLLAMTLPIKHWTQSW